MEIIKEENKIVVLNEQQKEIAYIIFPKLENNLVTLKSTYVDETLRGKGIKKFVKKREREHVKIRKDYQRL